MKSEFDNNETEYQDRKMLCERVIEDKNWK